MVLGDFIGNMGVVMTTEPIMTKWVAAEAPATVGVAFVVVNPGWQEAQDEDGEVVADTAPEAIAITVKWIQHDCDVFYRLGGDGLGRYVLTSSNPS